MTKSTTASIQQRLGKAIGDVAPTLAGALGGPLAGAAVGTISRAIFGRSDGDVAGLENVILAQSPETMVALRRAELEFRRAVIDADLEGRRIAADDRANARARQIALKDLTPTIMGITVIGGFFFVLCIMFWRELPAETDTEFSIMLGALATMTAAVVNYFFGSTADSREKTKIMAGQRP
ncbi:hypothetical protein [Parvularcula sp. LCG005]|uniref:hypothetical protein n=1 Tax=Parvularcula sp. LCG005 TaxID=3078805 RepID=UPI002943DEA6|nr:hypothetical protein [Parvularcula sp. LCG005]WOI54134.1 hypothetical protein RUI03_03815 [Parvularcula sp. LCG005]